MPTTILPLHFARRVPAATTLPTPPSPPRSLPPPCPCTPHPSIRLLAPRSSIYERTHTHAVKRHVGSNEQQGLDVWRRVYEDIVRRDISAESLFNM